MFSVSLNIEEEMSFTSFKELAARSAWSNVRITLLASLLFPLGQGAHLLAPGLEDHLRALRALGGAHQCQ
jgi:hypothetical protein